MGNLCKNHKNDPPTHPTLSHIQTASPLKQQPAAYNSQRSNLEEEYHINLSKPKGDQISNRKVSKSLYGSSVSIQRSTLMRTPQIPTPEGEFSRILAQPQPPTQLPEEKSMINSQELERWTNPIEQPSIFYDMQGYSFNPANQSFNVAIMCILSHSVLHTENLVPASRFSVVVREGKRKRYRTSLLINGCFRGVECLSKQGHWVTLLESAVFSTFLRNTTFLEHCFRILGWIPMQYFLPSQVKNPSFLLKVEENINQGNSIASVSIPGGGEICVVGFGQLKDGRKCVVGRREQSVEGCRLQTHCFQELESSQSQLVKLRQEDLLIYSLETLVDSKSILSVSTRPQLKHWAEFHDRWQQPDTLSNFDDKSLSLYSQPQYILALEPLAEHIELRILLNTHSQHFEEKSEATPKVCLFQYEGTRIVFLHEEKKPHYQYSHNDIYSAIHLLPANGDSLHYSLVVLCPSQQCTYSLQITSNRGFSAIKCSMDSKPSASASGQYNQSNTGGSIFCPNVLHNPLYLVRIPSEGQLEIFLQTEDRTVELNSLICKVEKELSSGEMLNFVSENYADFVDNYYGEGFFYQGLSYTKIVATKPSLYIYLPLAYHIEHPTSYQITLSCSSSPPPQIHLLHPQKYPCFSTLTAICEPEFTIKYPAWQDIFEITPELLRFKRVYYFSPELPTDAYLTLQNLSYAKSYGECSEEEIASVFYSQPEMGLILCKIKVVDGRMLGKVHKKTKLSRCPGGLRTQQLRLLEEVEYLLWGVIVLLGFEGDMGEVEYQLGLHSSRKVELSQMTTAKYQACLKE